MRRIVPQDGFNLPAVPFNLGLERLKEGEAVAARPGPVPIRHVLNRDERQLPHHRCPAGEASKREGAPAPVLFLPRPISCCGIDEPNLDSLRHAAGSHNGEQRGGHLVHRLR
jgi:hypothetical protein